LVRIIGITVSDPSPMLRGTRYKVECQMAEGDAVLELCKARMQMLGIFDAFWSGRLISLPVQ